MEQQTTNLKILGPAEVRALTGATRAELRLLEAKKIIQPTLTWRFSRHNRKYDEAQVEIIRRIKYLKSKGMTLAGAVAMLPELTQWEERNGKKSKAEKDARPPVPEGPATNHQEAPLGNADTASVGAATCAGGDATASSQLFPDRQP
jgi:DNA-binding transcriptional MerR regulator